MQPTEDDTGAVDMPEAEVELVTTKRELATYQRTQEPVTNDIAVFNPKAG